MKYGKLKIDLCGFYKGDICKIEKYYRIYFHVSVPNRTSTSNIAPLLGVYERDLIECTEEEYNKAHGIVENEILPEDLIEGEYYITINRKTKNIEWIFNYKKKDYNDIYCDGSFGSQSLIYYKQGFFKHVNEIIIKANQFQINWLDACIKANKYVPKNEVVKEDKDNVYPLLASKGQYVVLLSSCLGNDNWAGGGYMPINSVYLLSKDCYINDFYIKKDFNGNTDNGWSIKKIKHDNNKLRIRLATPKEINYYQLSDKPFKIDSTEYTFWLAGVNAIPVLDEFYIKYDEKVFTKSVYNKLINKLLKQGYASNNHMVKNKNNALSYNEFKKYGYLRSNTDAIEENYIIIDNNNQDIKIERFVDYYLNDLEIGNLNENSKFESSEPIIKGISLVNRIYLNKKRRRKLITVKQLNI